MIRIIIDRFEGQFAIVELPNKNTINISKELIPGEAKEGDVILIQIDKTETNKLKKEVKNLMNELWEK